MGSKVQKVKWGGRGEKKRKNRRAFESIGQGRVQGKDKENRQGRANKTENSYIKKLRKIIKQARGKVKVVEQVAIFRGCIRGSEGVWGCEV